MGQTFVIWWPNSRRYRSVWYLFSCTYLQACNLLWLEFVTLHLHHYGWRKYLGCSTIGTSNYSLGAPFDNLPSFRTFFYLIYCFTPANSIRRGFSCLFFNRKNTTNYVITYHGRPSKSMQFCCTNFRKLKLFKFGSIFYFLTWWAKRLLRKAILWS